MDVFYGIDKATLIRNYTPFLQKSQYWQEGEHGV